MKLSSVDLKMHLLKRLINSVAPKVLSMAKGVKAETPQSKLIERVWARLEDVLKKEVQTGCFDDDNFKVLLRSVKEALIFLCENDKYYKRWLGLMAFFLSEELTKMKSEFDFKQALAMTVRPLGLKKEEFERHKEALFEVYLTGYLYGMARCTTDIHKAREQKTYVDFNTIDPNCYIRLYFPDGKNACFSVFFKERDIHG